MAAKQEQIRNRMNEIRNELMDKGVVIEDQKEKTIWKYK